MGAHGWAKQEKNVPAGCNDERLRPRRRSNWTRYGVPWGWRLVLLHAPALPQRDPDGRWQLFAFQRWLLTALMLMLVLVLVPVLVLLCLCLCDWGALFVGFARLDYLLTFCLSLCAGTENPMAGSGLRNVKGGLRCGQKPSPGGRRLQVPIGTVRKAWKHSVPASPASKLSQAMAELADGMSRDCFVSPVQHSGFLAFCEVSERLLLSETKTLGRLEHWQLLDKKAPAVTLGGGWRTHDSEKRRCRTCLAALQSPHRGYSTSSLTDSH